MYHTWNTSGQQGGGGQGKGPGRGMGRGQGGGGIPRRFGAGPGGECVCPNCGYKESHVRGQPCNQKDCPRCGAKLAKA